MAGLFKKLFSAVMGKAARAAVTVPMAMLQPLQAIKDEAFALKPFQSAEQKLQEEMRESQEAIAQGRKAIFGNLQEQFRRAEELLSKQREEFVTQNSQEPWYGFVYSGHTITNGLDFQSSNVAQIHYEIGTNSLYIAYTNGWLYRYWSVSVREAAAIFNSRSKGVYVWDNLRIRGTRLGHRKNYQLVGAATRMPKWTQSKDSRAVHDRTVESESGASGTVEIMGIGNIGGQPPYDALGKFARSKPKLNIGNKETARGILGENVK